MIIREVLCLDYHGGLPSGLPLPVQHAWQAHAVTLDCVEVNISSYWNSM